MKHQRQILSISAQAGIPVLLWGKPGVGKTAQIQQFSEKMGWDLYTFIASLRDPSDLGMPILDEDGELRLAVHDWVRRIIDSDAHWLLFFDEISTAAPATQAVLLRVIHELVVGDTQLPRDRVSIVGAANPPKTGANAYELPAASANRWLHIDEWTVDNDGWMDYMQEGPKDNDWVVLDTNWPDRIPEEKIMASAFMKHRPDFLIKVPETRHERGKAWPSPRTWEQVAVALAAAGRNEDYWMGLTTGLVGESAGIEYLAWRRDLDLQDPEELLKDPHSLVIEDDRLDRAYAALTSVYSAVNRNCTVKRWEAGMKVVARGLELGYADVAATIVVKMSNIIPKGAEIDRDAFVPIMLVCREAGLIK